MEQVLMQAVVRAAGNKGEARRLRAGGQVPAVVYGAGKDPQVIAVPTAPLKKAIHQQHGSNLLVTLELEGQGPITALLKSLEIDPVTHAPTSADFQLVSLTELVQVTVNVTVIGEPVKGVVVDQLARELLVSCRPLDMPEAIVLDVTGLTMHETRLASEIVLPAGVELVGDGSDPVVSGVPEFANAQPGDEPVVAEAPAAE
jgi:large subunit ribosomal protein L25